MFEERRVFVWRMERCRTTYDIILSRCVSEAALVREREKERPAPHLSARAPFVFLRTARDVFGSRFAHIKRQMSFYGPHRHPGTACRESPVGILCQNFPSSQTSPFPGHGRLIKILNGPRPLRFNFAILRPCPPPIAISFPSHPPLL